MKKINLDSSKLMGYKMAVRLDAKVGEKPVIVGEPVNAASNKLGSKLGGKLGMKPIG